MKTENMQKIFDSVRNQYRAFYRRMAFEGMAWHLHHTPGTDQYSIFRRDAKFDVELPIVIHNVHCMTETTLLLKLQYIIRT